jgi:hypothetical protein
MIKRILAGLVLLIGLSTGIEAQVANQVMDRDCVPVMVPLECRSLSQSMARLEAALEQLRESASNSRSDVADQLQFRIERLQARRDSQRSSLRQCLLDHGITPRELAAEKQTATLVGRATIRAINRGAPRFVEGEFQVDLIFSRDRCEFSVLRFPTTRIKTDAIPNVGSIVITVDMIQGGRGRFFPLSGRMSLPISVHIDYGTARFNDEKVTLYLTTGNVRSSGGEWVASGSPVGEDNRVTFVGTTSLNNPFLRGDEVGVTVRGNIFFHR